MPLSLCTPWRVLYAMFLTLVLVNAQLPSEEDFTPKNTIARDVCILGGGATGTYAAIRLKDMDKSVVVVERNDHLGGHTETLYIENGSYVDYGVQGVFNYNISRNFFKRLGMQWKPAIPGSLSNKYVNFKTGHEVPPPSTATEAMEALRIYRATIQKFDSLKDGVYNLPDPVPEELLWPFSKFVKKYKFEAALSVIHSFANALGDMMATPTLYVIQLFGIPHIDIFLQGGYIRPEHGMYELYRKAGEVLGADVLYHSQAIKAIRPDSNASLITIIAQNTTSGKKTLIKAKKLLVTFPPILPNLGPLDLEPTETSLFARFLWKAYYIAVLKGTGIPNNINVHNADPHQQPGSLPRSPFQWALQDMGPQNYLASKIIGDAHFSASHACDLIVADLHRMRSAGTFAIREDWEMAAFGSHTPISAMVSVEDIQAGFYRRLYALQGHRHTFWTGLALASDYSALLWQYTDSVLGEMWEAG